MDLLFVLLAAAALRRSQIEVPSAPIDTLPAEHHHPVFPYTVTVDETEHGLILTENPPSGNVIEIILTPGADEAPVITDPVTPPVPPSPVPPPVVPGPLAATFVSPTGDMTASGPVSFTVDVEGGTPPYTVKAKLSGVPPSFALLGPKLTLPDMAMAGEGTVTFAFDFTGRPAEVNRVAVNVLDAAGGNVALDRLVTVPGAATPAPTPTPTPTPTPPPTGSTKPGIVGIWENTMLTLGAKHAATLTNLKDTSPVDTPMNYIYYDGARNFANMARHFNDARWLTSAAEAVYVYRDRYCRVNIPYGHTAATAWGNVANWMNFSLGLRMHYERTNGTPLGVSENAAISRETVNMLARFAGGGENVAYNPYMFRAFGLDPNGQPDFRGVAYQVQSFIDAKALGFGLSAANETRYQQSVDALHRYADWLVNPAGWQAFQIAPFMFGLCAESLIRLHTEVAPDPRTVPTLVKMADFLMQDKNTTLGAYDPARKAFLYRLNPNPAASGGVRDVNGTKDLNIFWAPAYVWLWKQTGQVAYRDLADALFASTFSGGRYDGNDGAYLHGGKQFQEAIRWSFDFMKWRYDIVSA